MQGLFVTGTDTGVGKTAISTVLARLLVENGVTVRPRKPVESGCLQADGSIIPADALKLKTAAQSQDPLELICPYQFEPAISPERAAMQAGLQLSLKALQQACLAQLQTDDYLLVEAAGGFYSPIAQQLRCSDLACVLRLPVLLVVADRLGCINHTLLTVQAIEQAGLQLQAVVLNQREMNTDSGMDNLSDLEAWLDCPVIGIKKQADLGLELFDELAQSQQLMQQLSALFHPATANSVVTG